MLHFNNFDQITILYPLILTLYNWGLNFCIRVHIGHMNGICFAAYPYQFFLCISDPLMYSYKIWALKMKWCTENPSFRFFRSIIWKSKYMGHHCTMVQFWGSCDNKIFQIYLRFRLDVLFFKRKWTFDQIMYIR